MLRGKWLEFRKKLFEDYEKNLKHYLELANNPQDIDTIKLREQLSKLIDKPKEQEVEGLINSYCNIEGDVLQNLIRFRLLFNLTWRTFYVGTVEQRGQLSDLVMQFFKIEFFNKES